MDLDDIGYFGLPINGVATPGLRKPKSTATVALTGVATTVARGNNRTATKQLQHEPKPINGECEKILPSRKRRRLNVEFGIHRCILGHRIIATTTTRMLMERRMQEQRVRRGTCGVNILSCLVQRSCIPSSTSSISLDIEKNANSGINWNICTTVELAASEDDDVDIAAGDVTAMSFDRDGVVLATGDDRGVVRIYDFDDVAAEDMKKRNEISRSLRQDYSVQCTNEREVDKDGQKSHVDSGIMVAEGDSNDDTHSIAFRSIPPSTARPVLSFQCNGSRSSSVNTGHRISSVLWSPYNQDHLVVSFANQREIHFYDTASEETPIPCLRLLDTRRSRSEGIPKAVFLPPLSSSTSTQILTGGNYGTVSLWTIPQNRLRHRAESISKLGAQCIWSVPAFAPKEEGVSDMMVLPMGASINESSNACTKPRVLIAGNGSSLALLDTNKCTRKAFSATITPSVVSSWDLYQYVLRELSTIYPEAKLPDRKWIAARKLTLLHHECTFGNSRIQIGIILKCGWILIAYLSLPNQSLSSSSVNIQIQIVRLTPRIQCFNSSNERLSTLGGMALQFSLPEIPVPSTNITGGAIWLADVKQKTYTLPSKDKYVLSEEHGTFTAQTNQLLKSDTSLPPWIRRHPGEGLILARLGTSIIENRQLPDSRICAWLPMSRGLPLSLAAHPSGEWVVVGHGRGATTLVTMRKKVATDRKDKNGAHIID